MRYERDFKWTPKSDNISFSKHSWNYKDEMKMMKINELQVIFKLLFSIKAKTIEFHCEKALLNLNGYFQLNLLKHLNYI